MYKRVIPTMKTKVVHILYEVACHVYRGEFDDGDDIDIDSVKDTIEEYFMGIKEERGASEEL